MGQRSPVSPRSENDDSSPAAASAEIGPALVAVGTAQSADVVTITPYRDGPLIVRGPFRILDADGRQIDPGRATVALCRCGRSALKPFCDGSHAVNGFRAKSGDERPPSPPHPDRQALAAVLDAAHDGPAKPD